MHTSKDGSDSGLLEARSTAMYCRPVQREIDAAVAIRRPGEPVGSRHDQAAVLRHARHLPLLRMNRVLHRLQDTTSLQE